MATAAKRKPNTAHKSTVRNPSGRRLLVGGRKPATRRGKRRNPATAIAKRTNARRTSYRRNPSENTGDLLFAFGGALAINAFDFTINKLAPSISAPIRIGGKAAVGWAFGAYGKKIPVIGNFAPVIRKALYLAAMLDAFNVYFMPTVLNWLGASAQPAIVSQQQVQNTSTGELGTRYFTQDGGMFDVFNQQQNEYAY